MSKLNCILLLLVISQIFTMDVGGSVEFDHEPDYTGLPNEFPSLTGLGLVGSNKDSDVKKRDKLYKLKNIIGALPFAEQIAFIKAMQDGGKVFSKSQYGSYVTSNHIYERELNSIIDYLEEYEKQMPYGLGCIQFTANKYVYDNEYNQDMHYLIYQNINKMFDMQKESIKSKLAFIQVLQRNLIINRQKLLEFTNSQINSNELLETNQAGVKFNQVQINETVAAFQNYLEAQREFTYKLGLYGIRAEIALSNMDGCRDYKNPDYSAGQSSTSFKNPKITYKKDRKPIGVNEDSQIGIEKRTSNGFKLHRGFFRGATLRNDQSSASIPSYIPRDYTNEINKYNTTLATALGTGIISLSLWSDFRSFNDSIYEENFAEILNESAFNQDKLEEAFKSNEALSNQIKNITNETTKCDQNYIIYCNSTSCEYVLTTNPNESLNWTEKISLATKVENTKTFIAICKYDESPLAFIISNDDKKEIIANHLRLSSSFRDTLQGCFGVFHSGGKHDKDACRDVIRPQCGTTLDYHCKKLGLYDYINSNPSSSADLPSSCINKTDINGCFAFIKNKFIVGGVALKPSSLIGTNLIIQNQETTSGFAYFETISKVTDPDPPCSYCEDMKGYKVLGVDIDGGDLNAFIVNMNKANNFILENGSNHLSFKLWNIFFLLLSLFLL